MIPIFLWSTDVSHPQTPPRDDGAAGAMGGASTIVAMGLLH
jgi:hypothetical protein